MGTLIRLTPEWLVRIHALGRFVLEVNGQPVEFPGKVQRKPLDVLRALVSQGPHGTSVEQLMSWLWPDLDGDAARNALDLALFRLRHLLGQRNLLRTQDGIVRLDTRRVWVDAWLVEQHCANGVADPIGNTEWLLEAYSGHLLPCSDAAWIYAARERLRSKLARHVHLAGKLLEQQRRFEQATNLYRQAVEIEPATETFHCGLMRCLQARGQTAETIAAYRHCREMLAQTLQTEPRLAAQLLAKDAE